MNQQDILQADVCEVYKGSIHLALFALASICAAYNVGAVYLRPDKRLVMNALTYTGLAVLEARQVRHHWGRA